MILKKEIEQIAEQQGVAKSTIDKDWVLGHFIDAIFSVEECRDRLIFKGGTCLRKCYFPDYRFSEDLDFTSTDPDFVLDKKLLSKIVSLVSERTELPLHVQDLKPLHHNDELTGYAATVKFWGADHPRNQPPPSPERWQTGIKIEIILYEKMIFSSSPRPVYHPYSDQLSDNAATIPCYSLNEVLAEKLRALIQRSYTAPRDFYDIWYLNRYSSEITWSKIIDAFYKKMAFKKLDFNGLEQFINEDNDKRLTNAWANSLGHQINKEQLPEYSTVRDELLNLFKEIFSHG